MHVFFHRCLHLFYVLHGNCFSFLSHSVLYFIGLFFLSLFYWHRTKQLCTTSGCFWSSCHKWPQPFQSFKTSGVPGPCTLVSIFTKHTNGCCRKWELVCGYNFFYKCSGHFVCHDGHHALQLILTLFLLDVVTIIIFHKLILAILPLILNI